MGNVFREWDDIRTDWTSVYKNNVVLYNTTDDLELFFSDGSVSILKKGSEITLNKLNFPKENNLTTFVKIALKTGAIWTKATHLNTDSEFQIQTSDSVAAVRWTIFWVSHSNGNWTDVVVVVWKVQVIKNQLDANWNETIIKELNTWDSVKTKNQEIIPWTTPAIRVTDFNNSIKTKFKLNHAIRDKTQIESIRTKNEQKEQVKQEETDKHTCMFNGEEIADWVTINNAYSSKTWITANDCESKKWNRTCTNWVLSNPDYAYATCTAPTQCPPYNKNWFSSNWSLNNWSYDLTKTVDTTDLHWTITYKRNITCNVPSYTENGDTIDNTTCDTGYSPSADWMNCIINSLQLFATANFNTAWNLDMTKTNGSIDITPQKWLYVVHSSCIGLPWWNCKSSNFTDRWCNYYVKNKSFCEYSSWIKWIFLNKNPWNDFLKYHLSGSDKLKDDEDFKIEMSVRVPASDWASHYLLNSWNNFRFFIYNWNLYYNNWSTTSTWLNLVIWQFNTVSIKKEWSEVSLKVNGWGWVDTGMTFNDDIENLYVWAFKLTTTSYINQINDIIDYVKIYK